VTANINFVIPKNGKYANYENFKGDLDKEWGFISNGQWAWIIQTFVRLSEYKNNTRLTSSESALEEAINVIFVDDYVNLKRKYKYYCIVIVLDRYVYYPGDLNLIQNEAHKMPFSSAYIPHWSQAGLIPRKENLLASNNAVNLGFFGLVENSVDLVAVLERNFGNKVKVHVRGPNNWNDYREIDIAVGIRDFDKRKYIQKPPTKLLNAWKAGVPFIGGADSSYEQVGIDGENYLKADSEELFIATVGRLISDPLLNHTLVEKGRDAFENYTDDKISDRWVKTLEEELTHFDQWQCSPHPIKALQVFSKYCFYNYLRVKRKALVLLNLY